MTAMRAFASEAAATIYNAINEARSPDQLDQLARLLWQGNGEGAIPDDDAAFLASCIDRRRPRGQATAPGFHRPIGNFTGRLGSRFTPHQRPRSPDRQASRDRRRMLGGSSVMPPELRHHFTEGQRAVLCILAGEVKQKGFCDLPIDKIAALAGVCRTTVQTTLHEARRLFHIRITERPQRGRKSLTNVVEVISPEWLAWIKRGPTTQGRIGSNFVNMVSTTKSKEREKVASEREGRSGQRWGN